MLFKSTIHRQIDQRGECEKMDRWRLRPCYSEEAAVVVGLFHASHGKWAITLRLLVERNPNDHLARSETDKTRV